MIYVFHRPPEVNSINFCKEQQQGAKQQALHVDKKRTIKITVEITMLPLLLLPLQLFALFMFPPTP